MKAMVYKSLSTVIDDLFAYVHSCSPASLLVDLLNHVPIGSSLRCPFCTAWRASETTSSSPYSYTRCVLSSLLHIRKYPYCFPDVIAHLRSAMDIPRRPQARQRVRPSLGSGGRDERRRWKSREQEDKIEERRWRRLSSWGTCFRWFRRYRRQRFSVHGLDYCAALFTLFDG